MRVGLNPGLWRRAGRRLGAGLLTGWLAADGAVQAGEAAREKPAKPDRVLPGAAIFSEPVVIPFRIEIPKPSLDKLRQEPREYASVTVTAGNEVFTNAALHLKGAAGSYRHVDDHPALTLSFSKFAEGRRWQGLRKIHLNNSVQDDSYMNEYLASELFRAAGVPTPRVAFATVELNRRKLGLYVLKEGWTEDFLKCFFRKTSGNLYDGGFVRDIDSSLELDQGKGATNLLDMDRLVEAAQELSRTQRWARLQQVLDVDRFASYLAMSVLLGDWDGYALNRNNYRIYFDPDSGRAVMMPHGMDQVFQRSEMELDPWFQGMLAQSFVKTAEGGALYRKRCRELYAEVFRWDRITNSIARVAEVLKPVQPDIAERAGWLRSSVRSRFRFLAREEWLKDLTPPPANASTTGAVPASWVPAEWEERPDGEAKLERVEAGGKAVLRISARGRSAASWRSAVRLPAGRYLFQGQARCEKLSALKDDRGEGAGLRISGGQTTGSGLQGTQDWTPLQHAFEVDEDEREVILVCELRALSGRVEFDLASLRVVTASP